MIRDIFIVSIFSFCMSHGVATEQHRDFLYDRMNQGQNIVAGFDLADELLQDFIFDQKERDISVNSIVSSIVDDPLFNMMSFVATIVDDQQLLVQLNIAENIAGSSDIATPDIKLFIRAWIASVDYLVKDLKSFIFSKDFHFKDFTQDLDDDDFKKIIIQQIRDCRDAADNLSDEVKKNKFSKDFLGQLRILYHALQHIKSEISQMPGDDVRLIYIKLLLSMIYSVLHHGQSLVAVTESISKIQQCVIDQIHFMVVRFQCYLKKY